MLLFPYCLLKSCCKTPGRSSSHTAFRGRAGGAVRLQEQWEHVLESF